jgi:hypothetical protein
MHFFPESSDAILAMQGYYMTMRLYVERGNVEIDSNGDSGIALIDQAAVGGLCVLRTSGTV